MKRITQTIGLALVATTLSGCGTLWGDDGYFRNRNADYLRAQITEPIEVPAQLSANIQEPLMPVPEHVADLRRNQKRALVPRPLPMPTGAEAAEFYLQQTEQISWIVAQRNAENVWTVTEAYFVDQGFQIAEQNPPRGEFITAWADATQLKQNFAEQTGLQPGEQVRYRVRVEPGVQRNTSEVFLDAARSAVAADSTPWSAVQGNPALATLHGYLSESIEVRDSYSLLASRNYNAAPRAVMVELEGRNRVLRLDASMDRSWFAVGRALERAGIVVTEEDAVQGVYIIDPERDEYAEPGFFEALFETFKELEREMQLDQMRPQPEGYEAEPESPLYRLKLAEIGHQVFISVELEDQVLAEPEITRTVLTTLQQQLN